MERLRVPGTTNQWMTAMESMQFNISRSLVIRSLVLRILLTLPALLLLYQFIALFITTQTRWDGEAILILVLFGLAVIILWISYFRIIQKIAVTSNEIQALSSLHTARMEIYDLISVKEIKGGRYLLFEGVDQSIVVPNHIVKRDDLLEAVKTANTNVEIQTFA